VADVNDRAWLALQVLAQQAGPWQLHRPALRVFFFVAADLDTDEYRAIKQVRVARALGLAQPAVSKALNELVRADYLQAGDPIRTSKTYRLNHLVAAVQALYAA
jgi:DNA-binding MarR family transcriptional regulator